MSLKDLVSRIFSGHEPAVWPPVEALQTPTQADAMEVEDMSDDDSSSTASQPSGCDEDLLLSDQEIRELET